MFLIVTGVGDALPNLLLNSCWTWTALCVSANLRTIKALWRGVNCTPTMMSSKLIQTDKWDSCSNHGLLDGVGNIINNVYSLKHVKHDKDEFIRPGGGGSFTKIVRGCACRTSKIWLSLYQFFAKFPTHQYTIFERKAPNLDQTGCFLQWFAQNTPNLCNLGSFVSDENPRSLYQISRKSAPKGRHIYVYHVNVRTPPPGSLGTIVHNK